MGKFNKVLIASDLDGTLTNDQGVITQDNKEALQYFISEGGLFTVSTGRTYMGFHKYDPLYINAPVLLCNGAMAYDYANKKIVFSNAITQAATPAIEEIIKRFPTVPIEMYPFDSTYAIHLNDESERHFTSQAIPFKVVESPQETVFPWIKAMLCAKEQTLKVQDFLKSKNFESISFLPTTGSYIELLAPGANKGSGLLQLAKCLQVDRKDVYAVGDDYNDTDMLEVASIAFVPANGKPAALEKAGRIVRSNNNGCIANVVEILDKLY